MSQVPATILVIVGITGDLSKRKLLPAIEKIVDSKAAPTKLKVLGVTRRPISSDEILHDVASSTDFLKQNIEMHQMDLTKATDYNQLKQRLADIAKDLGESTQRLFYLSIPPQLSYPVIKLLGNSGVVTNQTKLLLEKPFGVDLTSAQELIAQAKQYFQEDQIYRIDHYMAKEMAQNLVVFRQSNSLFRRTWNKDFIESIEIIASESISVEGRGAFYEQTGALRDLVQSHLLQLAALTLAELPQVGDLNISDQRLAALRQLIPPDDVTKYARRGQYRGYREEVGNPKSSVETFVDLTLFSNDPRWQSVPIRLMTGKALNKKTTEIRLRYRQDRADEANSLVLHIQPDEGVQIDLWTKQPGYDRKLQKLPLSFSYSTHFTDLPEAYERVFVDAMRSDHSLFTTSEEVLETWRILEPIQKAWEMNPDDLIIYEPGTIPQTD